MKTVYEVTTKADCPIDGERIFYHITIQLNHGRIEVGDLLAMLQSVTDEPVFQEDLTTSILQELKDTFGSTKDGRFDGKVTTVATHSGVKITCVA